MSSRIHRHVVIAGFLLSCFLAFCWYSGIIGEDYFAFDSNWLPSYEQLSSNVPFGGGSHRRPGRPLPRFWTMNEAKWTPEDEARFRSRPEGLNKTMGLVFYGRRTTVSILDCYLKRNLVKNGGMLDGVVWVERTNSQADLDYLDQILNSEPDYVRWTADMSPSYNKNSGYGAAYDLIEDDVLYVKMDDDIVFIEDSVIPSMLHTRMSHPEYYLVSANVINQPLLSWVHWSLGAIRPYLPDLEPYDDWIPLQDDFDWRPSSLPSWTGPPKFDAIDWKSDDGMKHRWLPIRGESADHKLWDTPIVDTRYDPFGVGLSKWQVAAQEHYSFFEHLENNELWRYRFSVWDFQLARLGIQFVALTGADINAAKPIDNDDEHHLGVAAPEKLHRRAVADGQGVAVHYSFNPQIEGMSTTDVLDRYRAFARESICAEPMLWPPVEVNREKDEPL